MRRGAITEDHKQRIQKLYERQPYMVEIDGLQLEISKGVFPSDAATATAMLMQTLREFEPTVAADVGCGCGVLALHLRRIGADLVYAVDLDRKAVECAQRNATRNGYNDIRILQSDLFSAVPRKIQFDLVVFNHASLLAVPGVDGAQPEGAESILTRFYDELDHYLVPNGAALLAFSGAANDPADPAALARIRGYELEEITYVEGKNLTEKVVIVYPNATLD